MSTEDFEQQKKSLFALINSWDEKNIKLATLIWQGNPALEEATHIEFKGILNAKDYKRLSALRLLANLNAMDSNSMEEEVQYVMKIHWLRINHANFDIFPKYYLQDLEQLKIVSSVLVELPDSIGALKQLKVLDLNGCRNLKKISSSIQNLTSLEELKIKGSRLGDQYGALYLGDSISIQEFFKTIFS
jgi:hypothetical protein